MKSIKQKHSLYKHVLNRKSLRPFGIMDNLGPSQISWELQKFIFLISEYCRVKFGDNPVPNEIIAFRDEMEMLLGQPEKRFGFELQDGEEEQQIVFVLRSFHMMLVCKGSSEVKSAIEDFNKVIPWVPPSPVYSHPSTPTSSLSPLTPSTDSNDGQNGAGGSGSTEGVSNSDSAEVVSASVSVE